jgi:hypothetical protein
MPAPRPGQKVGGKKVDAETYIPEPGDWEEPKVIFDFEDGWTITEAVTEYDRRLMAKLTLTCVSSLIPMCDPSPSYEDQLTAFKAKIEGKGYTERQMKDMLSNFEIDHRNKPKAYKLLYARDPENRPMSCILMVKKEVLDDPNKKRGLSYADSNDLGQSAAIELDGELYCISEVRLGTGKTGPLHVEDRVIQWFQAATGTWNEEAYLDKQTDRRSYGAWTAEQNLDLAPFRREAVAT